MKGRGREKEGEGMGGKGRGELPPHQLGSLDPPVASQDYRARQ